MKEILKRIVCNRWFMLAAVAVLGYGSYLYYMTEWSNFHTVVPGEVYRSARMDMDELEHFTKHYHIKTVLNLAGAHTDKVWYEDEVAWCRQNGLAHIDLRFPNKNQPSGIQLRILMQTFRTAPRPILIHCRSGADRTGLASAIWLYSMEGLTADDADRQLSWYYGHFSAFGSGVMDDCFAGWVRRHPRKILVRD